MNRKYYFEFEKPAHKQHTMFNLITLLSEHGQNKTLNLELMYSLFSAIYREELILLNKNLPLEQQIHWYNFDELLKKAPKDWFRVNEEDEEYKNWLTKVQRNLSQKEDESLKVDDRNSLSYAYIKMLQQPLIHVNILDMCDQIMLSQEAEQYVSLYEDKGFDQQNVEQSVMADIIKILRASDDPTSFEIYNLIRSSVAAKDMFVDLTTKRVKAHILEEFAYKSLKFDIETLVTKTGSPKIERVLNLFDELHDFIVGPTNIKYCKVCGNPVWGEECVGGILCSTKLNLGEEQYSTYSVDTGELVYYLKDGIIRYNSIPGIDELWLYKKLVDKYKKYDFVKVFIYPGKDAEGDICILIGDYRIIVDLKGWRKSWLLEEKISKNASAFKKTDYLFIPINLKLFYSNGLNGLNKTLKKNNLKTEAVSDRQFFSRIDDEIAIYLNKGELRADTITDNEEQGSFL